MTLTLRKLTNNWTICVPSNDSLSMKFQLCEDLVEYFSWNGFIQMIFVKICCIFECRGFVIFLPNSHKVSTIFSKHIRLSSRIFLKKRMFLFLFIDFYNLFDTTTVSTTSVKVAPAIRTRTICLLWKFDRSVILIFSFNIKYLK